MRLVLRCDGSERIGIGNLLRLVALAEAATEAGHEVIFAVRNDPVGPELPARRGFQVERVPDELSLDGEPEWLAGLVADGGRRGWAVVDGYRFDGRYLAAVRAAGPRVAAIDDLGVGKYPIDLVVNPNLYAPRLDLDALPSTVRLLGPRYALLRREFLAVRDAGHALHGAPSGRRRPEGAPLALLLAFGGSDPAGLTARTIDLLAAVIDHLPPIEVTAAVGPAQRAPEAVRAAAARAPYPIAVVEAGERMAELYRDADLAIAAAGSGALEMLCVGLPPLVVAAVSQQGQAAREIAARGAGLDLGDARELGASRLLAALRIAQVPGKRASFVAAGQALVDGRGAARVVEALEAASR
jgi:spore coat polysaccharide biosynthesis predicted glycosyltransferase SpsG